MAELSRQAQKRLRMTALAYAKTNAGYGTNIRIDQAKAMADLHDAAREFSEKTDKEWAAEIAEAQDRCATIEAASEKAMSLLWRWAPMFCDHVPGCESKDGYSPCDCGWKPDERALFDLTIAALRSARKGESKP